MQCDSASFFFNSKKTSTISYLMLMMLFWLHWTCIIEYSEADGIHLLLCDKEQRSSQMAPLVVELLCFCCVHQAVIGFTAAAWWCALNRRWTWNEIIWRNNNKSENVQIGRQWWGGWYSALEFAQNKWLQLWCICRLISRLGAVAQWMVWYWMI